MPTARAPASPATASAHAPAALTSRRAWRVPLPTPSRHPSATRVAARNGLSQISTAPALRAAAR